MNSAIVRDPDSNVLLKYYQHIRHYISCLLVMKNVDDDDDDCEIIVVCGGE